jgi:ABC-type phosphate transport system ATPase subunit
MSAMFPFPSGQVQAVANALRQHALVALCGPAGSGKHTLLQQAFPGLSVMRLECEVNAKNVEVYVKALQPTLAEEAPATVEVPYIRDPLGSPGSAHP